MGMVQITANQLLILTNIEHFWSSAIFLDIIIIPSHFNQSFLVDVEVDTDDSMIIHADDDFIFCDLFGWVECVTLFEVSCISLTSYTVRLTITESKTDFMQRSFPLHSCDSQLSEFFITFFSNRVYERN